MGHVTHMNESWVMWHIWMSHGSCDTYEYSHAQKWARSIGRRMSHVTHTNESCLMYEWVMSHVWMSHEYLHAEKLAGGIGRWMSHVSHMNESCLTYEWDMNTYMLWSELEALADGRINYLRVMSHIWMSHDTHTNEPWHTYKWVTWRIDE